MKLARILTVVCAMHSIAATAAVTITIEQSGNDLVATASGSLDISGATSCGAAGPIPAIFEFLAADNYAYIVGAVPSAGADVCLGLTFGTAQPLHSAAFSFFPSSGSGGMVGVENGGTGLNLFVPSGYVSGSPISATSTWAGQTLASMGLTPGTYVFDYSADNVTYVVIDSNTAPAQVPVMPVWMVAVLSLLLGMGAHSALRRRLKSSAR